MLTYREIEKRLTGKESIKIGNNTYLARRKNDSFAVQLHATDIVTFYQNRKIKIDSGGWRTVTTKDRINANLPEGYGVWQQNKVWKLSTLASIYIFKDGITVNLDTGKANGQIAKKGAETKFLKLDQKISKYVRDFVDNFFAGKIPAPSTGDCFGCQFVDEKTGKPVMGNDHLEMHIKEKYFVPSLLVNAINEIPISHAAHLVVHSFWHSGEPVEVFQEIAKRQITFSLKRYLRHKLGLAS